MPPPLTNAAERGTIEIEKESLPVRRLARFIYYLEKVADSLAGRLLFHAFEQFHHQCNDDSEYHHHQGENFKVTQSSPSLLHSFPSVWGYVNRGFRPSDRRPAAREQRFFALAKMQSLRLQAVLPVGCEAAYFVPFLGRLPHGIPCTSRIADISMDCNRAFGGAWPHGTIRGGCTPGKSRQGTAAERRVCARG